MHEQVISRNTVHNKASSLKSRRNRTLAACVAAVWLAGVSAIAASPTSDIRAFRTSHEKQIFAQYVDLLKIPNVASDHDNIRRNAEAIAALMRRLNLSPRLLEPAAFPDAPPAIYGEWRVPKAKRTLVLYAHYDGQPVNPAEWTTGPFTPTLRTGPITAGGSIISMEPMPDRLDPDARVYARGSSDDKAGVVAILSAIDALRSLHRQPTDNLKVIFEGEEEAGSPHLRDILQENRALFEAQLWVVCDGPVHQSGKKQVIYGARGDMNVSLTVYGPNRPLHSGHYGNWAPNPALGLARLLASMKDETGKVIVPGWYDDVVTLGVTERKAIAASADYDDTLRRQLGLAATESDRPLNESIALPSLNINGMRSGNVGDQATNMIAETATAVLDLRLVVGNDPQRQYQKLLAHVRSKGYYVIDREPTAEERLAHPLIAEMFAKPGSYAAARTPMDDPFANAIATAVRAASDQPLVELPTSGGSLPLSIIGEALGTRSIVVGIANYDNNQHSANENLRLGNLWEGIDLYGSLLTHASEP
jgi:acetylornithine deacetylase/succinyl-diaminopimelate desuccinylase-like protein